MPAARSFARRKQRADAIAEHKEISNGFSITEIPIPPIISSSPRVGGSPRRTGSEYSRCSGRAATRPIIAGGILRRPVEDDQIWLDLRQRHPGPTANRETRALCSRQRAACTRKVCTDQTFLDDQDGRVHNCSLTCRYPSERKRQTRGWSYARTRDRGYKMRHTTRSCVL